MNRFKIVKGREEGRNRDLYLGGPKLEGFEVKKPQLCVKVGRIERWNTRIENALPAIP
ncbi:hypothetical protein ACNHKD_04070 [Methylocystis sp. JAN1]|uniref:hypothetical protein n=1 Tax=Methylocystis sp. JAN1 TaxID=3397211 RepID=UPI003FA32CE0